MAYLRRQVAECSARYPAAGLSVLFSPSRRKSRRFAGRFALGLRSQGLPPNNPSERHLPDRTMGDFTANSLFRIFPKGQPGAGDRPLFHVLHGDAAWPATLLVAVRQALSNDRPEPQRTAEDRQFH